MLPIYCAPAFCVGAGKERQQVPQTCCGICPNAKSRAKCQSIMRLRFVSVCSKKRQQVPRHVVGFVRMPKAELSVSRAIIALQSSLQAIWFKQLKAEGGVA